MNQYSPSAIAAFEALKRGDRDAAASLLARDLKSSRMSSAQWLGTSSLASHIGEIETALEASRRALLPPTLENLIRHWGLLSSYGRSREALEEVARQPSQTRDHPVVLYFRATIANQHGRFEEAESLFRRALAAAPHVVECWSGIAAIKTFKPDDPDLESLIQLAQNMNRAPPRFRADLCYTLGKAFDDCDDIPRAYAVYQEGAEIRRAAHRYNSAKVDAQAAQVCSDFDAAGIARLVDPGANRQRALFVTGLPRSGTTLVEQMLIDHSAVGDGGEVNLLYPALLPTVDNSLAGALAYQKRVTDDPWGRVAADYGRFLSARFPGERLVVDKTLGQSLCVGLLMHSQPDARIAWLRRDPADNALSCFRTFFNDPVPWSWSWADIAHYFSAEDRLFAHWQSIYPDRILAVPYEKVTADPDQWSSRLREHFGLPVEQPAQFGSSSGRAIATASLRQVRNSISTARVGAAARYAPYMDEFRRHYRAPR